MTAWRVLSLIVLSASVHAAQQGNVGDSSTGSVQIRVVVPKLVSLTGISDISISPPSARGVDATGSTPLCLWSTSRSAALNIAQANSPKFQLTNDKKSIPFSVSVQVAGSSIPVQPGQAISGLRANPSDVKCGTGGANASLAIRISGADYEAATTGSYASTLTLVASPD